MSDDTGMVLMPRGNVQDMFDIIVASLDFGSGFLDWQQIEMLRAVAVLLGVDPMMATPSEHARSYPHRFETNSVWATAAPLRCRFCSQDSKHDCHVEAT